jgi:hypothetical protein
MVSLLATAAEAHFFLMSPTSATTQNTTGDPQKTGPCGGAGTASNMVTAVQTGGMLAVTIKETIDHPGHYRVSIAQNEAGLPAEPTVTGANCGAAAINANPTLPVLADGLFTNATVATGPQTAMVQLPAGYKCDNCVVQVLEFMSNHATPCFYYHCAKVTIADNLPDGAPIGAEIGDTVDGPPGTGGGDGGGCCSADGGAATGLFGFALFALMLRRRR